jgi:hypothetical protein
VEPQLLRLFWLFGQAPKRVGDLKSTVEKAATRSAMSRV